MVISKFPPVVGGAETQCKNLSIALSSKGHRITVLTEQCENLAQNETIDNVLIKRLPTLLPSVRPVANISFLFNLLFYLIKDRKDVDIIHSHVATFSAFVGSVFGKLLNKITIVKFTGSGRTGEVFTSSATFLGRLKLKLLGKLPDLIVCTDAEIEKELISVGFSPDKIKIVPNGVNSDYFCHAPEKTSGELTVLFTGRLMPIKNIPALLKAWQIVSSSTKAKLNIIGMGGQFNELKKLTEELQITDSIKFTGQITNIREYLWSSDVFVLPSFAEGISNALLEAMSCGLPAVASNRGGTKYLVENNVSGFLFEPDDYKDLAQKILALLNDAGLRQKTGQKARERIENHYSIKAVAEKYTALYNELLKQ